MSNSMLKKMPMGNWVRRAVEFPRVRSACRAQSLQSGQVVSSPRTKHSRSDSGAAAARADSGMQQLHKWNRPPTSVDRVAAGHREKRPRNPSPAGSGSRPTSRGQHSSWPTTASPQLGPAENSAPPRRETDRSDQAPRKTPRCRRRPSSRFVDASLRRQNRLREPIVVVLDLRLRQRGVLAKHFVQRPTTRWTAVASGFLQHGLDQFTPFRQRQLSEPLQNFNRGGAHGRTLPTNGGSIN